MTPSKSSSYDLGHVGFKICFSKAIAQFDIKEAVSKSVHYMISYATLWGSSRQ